MKEKKQNWYKNQRKYHFIYKTTCLVNGKFYYGMHSTDDLEDGYLGSGTYLAKAIRRHKRENFSIEILEFCDDRESLKKREAELITEEVLQDKMCMNLKLGGEGGFTLSDEQYKSRNLKCQEKRLALYKDEAWLKNHRAKSHEAAKKRVAEGKSNHLKCDWSGKKHSEESKLKMSEFQKQNQAGEKNSQFGTCWIYSLVEARSMKIKLADLESFITTGWQRGRKQFANKCLQDEKIMI